MNSVRNRLLKKILIAVACMGCIFFSSSCSTTSHNKKISFEIEQIGDFVFLRIKNENEMQIIMQNANRVSIDKREPGIIFLIEDSDGKKKQMCAMIDSRYGPGDVAETSVKPDETVYFKWHKDTLARRYCLLPGKYSLSAVLQQKNDTHKSNRIDFISDFNSPQPRSFGE
jgi:hypothetical protein